MPYPSIIHIPLLENVTRKKNVQLVSVQLIAPSIAPVKSQSMLSCPAQLNTTDKVPPRFKPYYGNTSFFHCGFTVILEDRIPNPSVPQNECAYDHTGLLVDDNHSYAGCRGTPNFYDSETDKWNHFWNDPGGSWQAGIPALITSIRHFLDQHFERESQRLLECNKTCEGLPWYTNGICLQSCNPYGM